MTRTNVLSVAALALSLFAGACGEQVAAEPAAGSAAPAAAQAAAPAATGNVIEVKMVTDEKGNYFEPAQIDAKPGDVVRFTLVSGVHNVSFPADKNPGKTGLPAPSNYLQMSGQTVDITVPQSTGEHGFQCDPHAALGMVGKLNVQP